MQSPCQTPIFLISKMKKCRLNESIYIPSFETFLANNKKNDRKISDAISIETRTSEVDSGNNFPGITINFFENENLLNNNTFLIKSSIFNIS